MLTLEGCRTRLQRFLAAMERARVDVSILGSYRSIYYLTGNLREVEWPQVLVVESNGNLHLISDGLREGIRANVYSYETMSLHWPVSFVGVVERVDSILQSILARLPGAVSRIAVERDRLSARLFETIRTHSPSAALADAADLLNPLRRAKDADEVDLIRECVECIEAGYAAARDAIHAGATELDVFEKVHGAIVQRAGYQLKMQGDFACGVRALTEWGTPLRRQLQAGDLYVMDIYPSFQGYHGDLCRTFAVSAPTDQQMEVWELVHSALTQVDSMIRPGVKGSEVWQAVRDMVDTHPLVRGSFGHHAGHGVGLDAQEAPWMIPGADHVIQAGDVIAVEPGAYAEALQGGIRLEHTYFVTAAGVENLARFPLAL